MQSEINATNERTKGYTSLQSITNLKKQSCHKGGFGINNWLYTLARPTIDYVVFPSLYLVVSESHIAQAISRGDITLRPNMVQD